MRIKRINKMKITFITLFFFISASIFCQNPEIRYIDTTIKIDGEFKFSIDGEFWVSEIYFPRPNEEIKSVAS